jgi:P pilus assembly chaperone PapD
MRLYTHILSVKKTFPKFFLLSVVLTNLLLSPSVYAGISVSPLSATLTLKDKRSHLLTVINTDQKRPKAIRVKALKWQLDHQGNDIRSPTDDLILFPIQFILPAGGRRSIRVASRIHVAPALEDSYRVMVQEVPVDLQGENEIRTGVRLITSYATAFYIAPLRPLSKLVIKDLTITQHQLNFTLLNNGNAHTHLHELSIMILQDNKEYIIDEPEALKGIYNENMLANGQRAFIYTWSDSLRESLNMEAPMKVKLKINCESCGGIPTVLNAQTP